MTVNDRVSRSCESQWLTSAEFTVLDGWDIGLIAVRKPTRLYPIEPVGLDTPLVEGLASYISALAEAHCVSVGTFLSCEVLPQFGSALVADGESRRFLNWRRINGIGGISKEIVSALEEKTGFRGLDRLTTLPLEGHISPDFCHARRRWCPYCLDEIRRNGRVFEPLLWSISAVTVCPKHNCTLRDLCPMCLRGSHPIEKWSRAGHCPRCGCWLGESQGAGSEELGADRSALAKNATMVGDLLVKALILKQEGCENIVRRNLHRCIEVTTKGNVRAFSQACSFPLHILHMLKKNLPKMDMLLSFANRLDIPLAVFFELDSDACEVFWQYAARHIDPAICNSIQRAGSELKQLLVEATIELPPPELWIVAKRLGYRSTRVLYQTDGALCRQITENFLRSIRNGEQKRNRGIPISKTTRIRNILEESLARVNPESLEDTARRVGYSASKSLIDIAPDLCAQISRKRAEQRLRQLTVEREVLTLALDEQPVPTLSELSARLGYRNNFKLTSHHPELCKAITSCRRIQRAERFAATRTVVEEMLREVSFTWDELLQKIGMTRGFFQEFFPDLYVRVLLKCKKSREMRRDERIEVTKQEVKRAVGYLATRGIQPSIHRIIELLSKDCCRGEKWVRRVLQELHITRELRLSST